MVEGGVAGADYLLPAGPLDCSSSSLEVVADVLSEEDVLSLPPLTPFTGGGVIIRRINLDSPLLGV